MLQFVFRKAVTKELLSNGKVIRREEIEFNAFEKENKEIKNEIGTY